MSLANDVKISRKNGHFVENIVLGLFRRTVGRCPAHHLLVKKKEHGCFVKVNSYQFGYNENHAVVT